MNEKQKKALDALNALGRISAPLEEALVCLIGLIEPEPEPELIKPEPVMPVPDTWEDKGDACYKAEAEHVRALLRLWVHRLGEPRPERPPLLHKMQARRLYKMLGNFLNGKRLDGKEGER